MGVATSLGLEGGLQSPVLIGAAAAWEGWVAQAPELDVVGGLANLQTWSFRAGAGDADAVLRALTWAGSPSGGDDRSAVAAAAWALLPGACVLARRLRSLSPQVDDLVASHLWVQLRIFPWDRLGRVAANVLANTRNRVLADHGVGRHARRREPAVVPVDPRSPLWARLATGPDVTDPAMTVSWLLTEAVERRVLSSADRALIGLLLARAEPRPSADGQTVDRGDGQIDKCTDDRSLEHLDRITGPSGAAGVCRGRGGLLAARLVDAVAQELGMSPATVRRRVRRAADAVAEATRSGLIEAA